MMNGPTVESIRTAQGYDELQPVLDELSREAGKMATTDRASAERVQAMTSALDEARLLLNELTHREVRTRGTSREAVHRHLELECAIKNIGSLLDLAIKRVRG